MTGPVNPKQFACISESVRNRPDEWKPSPRLKLQDDPIRDQYLVYYGQCNTDIYNIDQLPADQRSLPNVVADRATIVAQQAILGQIYQKDDATKTLAEFITDCAPALANITDAYQDAMGGGGTIQQKIEADFTSGQNIITQVATTLTQDAAALNVSSFQTTLTALQAQIAALPDGSQKTQAQADLALAQTAFATLQGACTTAQGGIDGLQARLAYMQEPVTGQLMQLQLLANRASPVQGDLTWAGVLLGDIQNLQTNVAAFQTGTAMTAVTTDTTALQAAIQKVQNDLNPPTPPKPGAIENACWDIDWTTHWDIGTTLVPEGVNMVNLFVGGLALTNGVPALVDNCLTAPVFQAFVKQCNEKGVGVKISIGGAESGIYGNCWDVLTSNNVNAFAQMLTSACSTLGLAGVDFDYEEYASPAQEQLVGQLIRQCKTVNPALQTSLCTNAGFGDQYQWPGVVQNIMDAAVDPVSGKCTLDRLYIMSYYDPMSAEQGWVTQWAQWTKQRYNFEASQITVGIDDFDAHAYDIGQFAAWAGQQGYSTGYWAWNPATPTQSNQSSNEIFNSYKNKSVSKKWFVITKVWSAVSSVFKAIGAAFSYLLKPTSVDKMARERAIIKQGRKNARLEKIAAINARWQAERAKRQSVEQDRSAVAPTAPPASPTASVTSEGFGDPS